jgi:hypothetical protein
MTESVHAPRHLWVIGILALIWNAMGAFDYVMTETRNEAYMAKFTAEQLDYFYSFPVWVVACWAIAVWGSVAASILLLLRKRLAESVFLVAFVAMVITTIYNYGISDGLEAMGEGAGNLVFSGLIFVVALLLWLYARAMRRRGVLV